MDERIIDRVLEGDRKAFAMLVSAYEKPVYNVAYRILHHPEDAADATQSTFLKAYQKLETFDRERRFFSWLYRIAINEAINLRRGRRPGAEAALDLPSAGPSPEDDYELTELCEALERALSGMSLEHRVVVILKHLLALSYAEIAEILEIPEKTVKSRLYEGRQALKSRLVAQGYVG
ncbi:MAG: sigma-70 family RNA polymerase sigma factor [Candidatus Krumholzibacteriia bacterium]